MTLQEVIKTGLPFRRQAWDSNTGYVIIDDYNVFAWQHLMDTVGHHADYIPTPDDVLAEDWEIKSSSILN